MADYSVSDKVIIIIYFVIILDVFSKWIIQSSLNTFIYLNSYYTELASVNFSFHLLFCVFPVLWTLGLLPPLDALFAWVAEQALVLVLGGSPMASDFRFG